jgi:hypothetical protein
METLHAAVDFANAAIPVFRTNGKVPDEAHGFKDATVDAAEAFGRFNENPGAGLAIPTGEASGWTVIDVDPRNGGLSTLEALEREHGELPATAKQRTPSGGFHLLFRYDARLKPRNGALGPGVDVKSDGGYIVVAPSADYTWERSPLDTELAPIPEWVLGAQVAPDGLRGDVPREMPEKIPYGRQHDHLVSLAGSMRRRGMSESAIAAALKAENQGRCERPGPDSNMERIARSAMQWEPDGDAPLTVPPPAPLDDAPSTAPCATSYPTCHPSPIGFGTGTSAGGSSPFPSRLRRRARRCSCSGSWPPGRGARTSWGEALPREAVSS